APCCTGRPSPHSAKRGAISSAASSARWAIAGSTSSPTKRSRANVRSCASASGAARSVAHRRFASKTLARPRNSVGASVPVTIGSILLWLLAAALAGLLGDFAFVTARVARQAERLVPPPGRFVTIDGHRIHYFDRRQGRPIVFIHGLGGTQFHFLPLFAALERDFRLVALDRPGSGYSTRVGLTPASPKQHAAFIARFIDELGLERPLLVGHSLGGAIALAVALDHPDKISGLALIAP